MIKDTAVGQEHGYQDPAAYTEAAADVAARRALLARSDPPEQLPATAEAHAIHEHVDWTDPLEVAAIVLLAGGPKGGMTMEEALSNAGAPKGQEQLGYTWARQEPSQRQRYRRMADGVARAAAYARSRQ